MKKQWGIILAIAAGILLLFNFFSIKELKYFFNKEGKYKVIKVLDGDTFVIPPDQIIRLASIDAPGIEFCLGKEAKERLEKLILNKYVKIVSGGRDNFYRSLALVYVDGKLVNEIMVVEGLARYSRGGVFPETKEAKERIKANAIKRQIWKNPSAKSKAMLTRRDRQEFTIFRGVPNTNTP